MFTVAAFIDTFCLTDWICPVFFLLFYCRSVAFWGRKLSSKTSYSLDSVHTEVNISSKVAVVVCTSVQNYYFAYLFLLAILMLTFCLKKDVQEFVHVMPNGFCCQINYLIFPSFLVIGKYGACNFDIMLAELNLPVGTNSILYIWGRGWRGGESKRLPPVWPDFKSQCRRYIWVKLVVGALLCSKRFFSRYSGFPLFTKTNVSKFQFCQEW